MDYDSHSMFPYLQKGEFSFYPLFSSVRILLLSSYTHNSYLDSQQ